LVGYNFTDFNIRLVSKNEIFTGQNFIAAVQLEEKSQN
jgi:hypothetical protein